MSATTVTFKFPALLASLTKTKARSWVESHGMGTGCGLDYYYDGPNGMYAHINVDQTAVSVVVSSEEDDAIGGYEGDYSEDKFLKAFVKEG